MKILFDFVHPADINLFKHSILYLNTNNHKVFVILQDRGKLIPIYLKEIKNIEYTIVGKHSNKLVLNILNTIKRTIVIFKILLHIKPDVVVSLGSISLNHASFMLKIPSLVFEDDFEYKLGLYPYIMFTKKIIIPKVFKKKFNNRFIMFNGFKELAYLHDKYFKPNLNVLNAYGLSEKKYILFRITKISSNYKRVNNNIDDIINFLKSQGYDVVLSLEDKTQIQKYIKKCIILNEPIKNFYSLLFYAKLLVSNGDTMSRESCTLGTPAIFLGGRNMIINQSFIKMGLLYEANDFHEFVTSFHTINSNSNEYYLNKRKKIVNFYENTTEVLIKNIEDYNNDIFI